MQLDTVVKFDLGVKRCILTAIDLYTRFTFAFAYTRLSSDIALDLCNKLELVALFRIAAVKTDNGLEFPGNFDVHLRKKGVIHYFSYPRTPKSNAYIERFNRTIQDDFVDDHLELLPDVISFNDDMMKYLVFYNTVRPHKSLKQQSPMGGLCSWRIQSPICCGRA